jgi:uncharacterized protein with HEPN domain
VHCYDTVDDEIVHDTIRGDLSGLIAALRALLDGEAEV